MSGTRRLSVLAVAAAAVAALVPSGARAEHCANNVIIFSRIGVVAPDPVGTRGNPTADSDVIGCLILADVDGDGHEENTNWIYPGANMVKIRYIQDLGEGVTVPAHLSGLGLDQDVTLERAELTTPGDFSMESPWVAIDPAEIGTLTATLTLADGSTEANEYRTLL